MWIIKNRVTGEYDKRGMRNDFSKINRSGWSKIAHAKSHVAQKVKPFRLDTVALKWFMDADFIEIDESGTHDIIPVGEYLANYLLDDKWTKIPVEFTKRLEEYRNAGN